MYSSPCSAPQGCPNIAIENLNFTTRKNFIGEGHAYDGPLRSVTNVTHGDGPSKIIVVSVSSDGPLRIVTKAIYNDSFGEGH